MIHSTRRKSRDNRHAASGRSRYQSALWRRLAEPPRHLPSKRGIGRSSDDRPFVPPEDWYQPDGTAASGDFRVIDQVAGSGYRHVVSADQVRDRLRQLPTRFIEPLEVVQLSRMTRKKQTYPCYGMQWGSAIYLYPLEESLIEFFARPPKPAERREASMHGGRWKQAGAAGWQLVWTPQTACDFYLNNVLLHELAHLLDDRNSSYADRERFAEWFAMEWGRRPARIRGVRFCRQKRGVRRRHNG